MSKRVSVCAALGALTLFAGVGVKAQSTYSNAVMSLDPAAYWPLSETVAPSVADLYVAANLGSAQSAGNGYYETWWTNGAPGFALTNVNNITHVAGAIQGDSDTAMQIGGTGQYLVWPRSTNSVANSVVTLQPPFSIEMWVFVPTVPTGLKSLFAEGGNNIQTGPAFGNALGQEGVEIGMNTSHFYFKTYDGPVVAGSSEATTAGQVTANAWYHLVFTCDGTTKIAYVNTVAVTQTLTARNSLGQLYMPDLVSPMILGNGDELGSGSSAPLSGSVDEFAIYTNVLSSAQVAAHYAAGTNAATATSYLQTVLNDNPAIYTRLDEAPFTGPSLASLPVATNYGSLGVSANGLYQPGTAPGAPGPAYTGFGASSYAVSINGFNGGVDVGGGALPSSLNPTGTQPMTITTWFRGNPADAGPRFQDLVSHGTNSYRLGLDLTPGNFFNPGAGPQLAFSSANDMYASGMNLNDGQWHMAAGVSDGTNEFSYLDGVLVKSGTSVAAIPGNSRDLILGGDPYFLGPLPTAPTGDRGGLFYDGSIAQVAYFTNALTAAQVQQIFSAANVPPVIHEQPTNSVSSSYSAGTTLAFPTTVSGSSPVSYQWYSTNGSAVSGQIASSLVFSNSTTSESGGYYLVATNLYGAATSAVVSLTIYGPPVITQSTTPDVRVFAGSSPVLNLNALGSQPFTYLWTSNGVSISGATNSNYTASAGQLGAAIYIGMVGNAFGSAFVTNVVTVLADPTAPYPVRVLADDPIAYFRLDESSGTTAYDYVGGYNATYTNVVLGVSGYDPTQDPSETAAEFGDYPPNNDYAGNVPGNLTFATNSGNGEFTVEAWVNQYFTSVNDGIVTLGYGGANQFSLDTGAGTGFLRFGVRNAANVSTLANSTVSVADGYWHHVVGVCDEAGGHIYLYRDGVQVATAAITPGSGILSSTIPLSIGARESANNNPVSYDYQFVGEIDDVAVYNKALSASQVQNHYFTTGVPPVITQIVPSSQTADPGDNVAFTVSAVGASPLAYQWYDNNGGPISWGTNATLNLTNVQSSQSGTYSVTVSDPYNSASTNALLSVGAGAPAISVNLSPTNAIYYVGTSNTFSITVSGTPPFAYQWYQDGAAVGGATNGSYTFAVLLGTNTYYCAVTNANSGNTPTLSGTGTVAGISVPGTLVLNPSNFSYKVKIQFSGYNRGETLQDFPALVRLGTNVAGFSYSQFASPTGGDLRFADSSGTVSLPYEINQWNDAGGNSTIWVQVPALTGTNNFIWAFWGNPSSVTSPDYTTNGAVWLPPAIQSLPPYELVYHLEQSGFPFLDSTLQYPATNGIAPAPAAGLIGQGLSFSKTPYLDAGLVNLGNAFTLSAWVNVSSSASSIQTVWGNGNGVAESAECLFYVNNFNTSDGSLILTTGDGGATEQQLKSAPGVVSFDQWHLVTAVIDRADGDAQLYVDGNQVASGPAMTDFPTNTDMDLGQDNGNSFQFTGVMDEARIRSSLNSTNWVWASWMTVAQNNTFESYSAISSSIVTLNIRPAGNGIILTWPEGTLQSAGAVTGPYSDIPAAVSPYTNAVPGTQEFYRVRVQ